MPGLVLPHLILPGQQRGSSWLCLCSQLDFGPCSWEPEAAAGSLHPHSAWKQAGQGNIASPRAGRQRLHRAGSCWDMGSPYSRGTPGVCRRGQQSSQCPLAPAPSPCWGQPLGWQQPEQFWRAGTHTGPVPLHHGGYKPILPHQDCSLPPSSHNPDFYWPLLLQTSQGWAFTRPRRESQPQPALHGSTLPGPAAAHEDFTTQPCPRSGSS